jgi:starch-binding outer membrane protein, SusD/RagB family
MKTYYKILLLMLPFLAGCQKYLDANPNASQVLPKDNLNNLQLLLNDTRIMNQNTVAAGEVGTDNVYLSDAQLQKLGAANPTVESLYIWQGEVFNEPNEVHSNDWTNAYNTVFNANLVLDALPQTAGGTTTEQGNNIKGQALFFRAFSFYGLLSEFAKQYDSGMAKNDLGIVLRLTSDISVKSKRSSVEDCYNQVTSDLQEAVKLLPASQSYATTPNKAAAMGLLARVYLCMGNYAGALNFAKEYLATAPQLIDYNSLSPVASYPFSRYNQEVTFDAKLFNFGPYGSNYSRVNDSLYAQYDSNDLRKVLFFKNGGPGNVAFKGSYYGGSSMFTGISNDEMYLTAAECYARLGDVPNAMLTLNALLVTRWKTGTFVPLAAINQSNGLQQILSERRKELVYRNLRWSDLKRLNLDPATQTTLTRFSGGQQYVLAPNDERYVIKIPDNVISLSGIPQN